MRTPTYPDSKRAREASRLARIGTTGAGCSEAAVFWDIGLVLAVFLGLALTITAALTAFGVN